ncbi:MAG: hypothetical protein HC933_00720 [Pleurocapsa sp. SU_196_0]|nr:hypothetical protein [Pleurocapsa sp. SU_196_0]
MNIASRDYEDFQSPLDHIRAKHLSSAELRLHADKLAQIQGFGFAQVIRDEADRVELLERFSAEANRVRRQTITVELFVGEARQFVAEAQKQPQLCMIGSVAADLQQRIQRLPEPPVVQERLW